MKLSSKGYRMKIPKKHIICLTFKWEEKTYIITKSSTDNVIYTLFKKEDNDYTQLCTSNSPITLENKVYNGKI